ncbi:cell wall-active antibiotics response protein LiaF [Paenibacillus sp. FJAT-26967]|uniref:cell wall-active antibiotics response protein LiaF n=1 Tax=Paenibacillus sp. FJAT-26967 TaxID=1729690 RepID=UPI000837E32D|nr:cell wall-active antibiotics response protein LiaF [Paenibacillus sp. FJAT-26967]
MEQQTNNNNRHRNTALLLIAVGIFLILERWFGIFVVIALVLMLFGFYKVKYESQKKGIIIMSIGAVILLGNDFSLVLAIILISLGVFYIRSRKFQPGDEFVQRQHLIDTIRPGKEPWVLKDSSIWFVMGEVHMDFSYAILDKKETTLVLQGIIGDVRLIVPEEIGVSIESSVTIGQVSSPSQKESGVMNKLVWQSPNYDTRENQVKLIVSFIVGDVDVRLL